MLVDRFMKYVEVDSETKSEKEIAELLKKELDNLGFDTMIDDSGSLCGGNTGNVIAYLKGNVDGADSIMFSSHMDTVMPGKNIRPTIENGIIKSEGNTILGADDKSGIACIMEAITIIKEKNESHPDIEILFTIGEESGMNGSKNVDYSKFKSKICVVVDSSGEVGGIVTKAPAQSKVKAVVNGKVAHAGLSPEKGISAIMLMADAIYNMELLRIDEETTANIGTISGGTATNVVAQSCEVIIECRSLNIEKLNKYTKKIENCIEKSAEKYGGTAIIDTDIMYPSLNISDDEKIVKLVSKAMEKAGVKGFTRSTGGGSDANILNSKGIKTVNINCGAKNVHTTNESISLEQLEKLYCVIYNIIRGDRDDF